MVWPPAKLWTPREWRQSVEKRLNDLLDRVMSLITALDLMEVDYDLPSDPREVAHCDRYGPLPQVAGLLFLVAEKSRSLNMQGFNRRELIIQLSEAYRCSHGQRGRPTPPELAPAASGGGLFQCMIQPAARPISMIAMTTVAMVTAKARRRS
jgi:hypothetical protein